MVLVYSETFPGGEVEHDFGEVVWPNAEPEAGSVVHEMPGGQVWHPPGIRCDRCPGTVELWEWTEGLRPW